MTSVFVRFELDGVVLESDMPPRVGFEDSIEVMSVSYSLSRRVAQGGTVRGGLDVGRIPGVEIVKRVDPATPVFATALADGRPIQLLIQSTEPSTSGDGTEDNNFRLAIDDARLAAQEVFLGAPQYASPSTPTGQWVRLERLVFTYPVMTVTHLGASTSEGVVEWALNP